MKKIALFLVAAAMVSFVACKGGEDKEKMKQDSIREADSIKKIEDSMSAIKAAEEAKIKADSTAKADSIKAAEEKGKKKK